MASNNHFVMFNIYHNILINVKKKYYILCILKLVGSLKPFEPKMNDQISTPIDELAINNAIWLCYPP